MRRGSPPRSGAPRGGPAARRGRRRPCRGAGERGPPRSRPRRDQLATYRRPARTGVRNGLVTRPAIQFLRYDARAAATLRAEIEDLYRRSYVERIARGDEFG